MSGNVVTHLMHLADTLAQKLTDARAAKLASPNKVDKTQISDVTRDITVYFRNNSHEKCPTCQYIANV